MPLNLAEFLIREGCDELQGYYYFRPMPAKDFTRILSDAQKTDSKLAG